jgi:hypothetical protein
MLELMRVRNGRPAKAFRLSLGSAALAALLAGSACLSQPRARPVVAPDGAPAIHVSCGSDQGACFALAGQYCPNGYRLKPIFDVASNNFLVRCREDMPVVQAPSSPSTVVVRSLGSNAPSTWPPPEQPWPAANPWPSGGAANNAPLPETARLPDGEVDIGY